MHRIFIFINVLCVLSGCNTYNYQPTSMALPSLKQKGDCEVSPYLGYNSGFYLGGLQTHYALHNNFYVGMQGQYAGNRHKDTISTINLGFGGSGHQERIRPYDFRRRSRSVGLSLGSMFRKGRAVFHLSTGVDFEDNMRFCKQIEREWDAHTILHRADFFAHASYLKPWAQIGLQFRVNTPKIENNYEELSLLLGTRISTSYLQARRQSITIFEGQPISDYNWFQFATLPNQRNSIADIMAGFNSTRRRFNIRYTIHWSGIHIETKNWFATPFLTHRIQVAYTFPTAGM